MLSFNNQEIKISAVSGTLTKTFVNSFFVNCHIHSPLANKLFRAKPLYDNKEVIVLQAMLCNNDWLLVEIVYEKDIAEFMRYGNDN